MAKTLLPMLGKFFCACAEANLARDCQCASRKEFINQDNRDSKSYKENEKTNYNVTLQPKPSMLKTLKHDNMN